VISIRPPSPLTHEQLQNLYHSQKPFDKQEMLRDIFLWSVYEGYIDIAFVVLLQLKSRISAALVAAGMAHHLSFIGHNPQLRNTYKEHRAAYESYATACIDACYECSERRAGQLLLREIPLFGNITCMQVRQIQLFNRECHVFCLQAAVASRSIPFINTNCFNQVLNRQWYDHVDGTSLGTVWGTCRFILHLASFGVLAPRLLEYRSGDESKEKVYLAFLIITFQCFVILIY
jgi:hypothetical protein